MDAKQTQQILKTIQSTPDLTPREKVLLQTIDYLPDENRKLKEENQQLREEIQYLRDEIARLNGEKGKPTIKKNVVPKEKNDPADKALQPSKKHRKRAKKANLPVDETQRISLEKTQLPPDAVNKGVDTVVIQELIFQRNNIKFELEQFYSPSEGKFYRAPLPVDFQRWSFGPMVRGFILYQYHKNRVTQPLLLQSLKDLGIDMSAGELSNILTHKSTCFFDEADEMYKAGLKASGYVHVDDSGARHCATNHYTTSICNNFFTMYFTRKHKNRLNFLDILCGGKGLRYQFNDFTSLMLDDIKLTDPERQYFSSLGGKRFSSLDEFRESVLSGLKKLPSKKKWTQLQEAAALSYYLNQTEYPIIEGLMSDEAGQFELAYWLVHGICWVHIDRDFKKLILYDEDSRSALTDFRNDFWTLYKNLKAYSADPSDDQKLALSDEFDILFSRQTVSEELNGLIRTTKSKKHKLLAVLDAPYLPLHNNPAEQAQRVRVIKNKISYGTRSDTGLKTLDTMQSLMETCKKLGLSFWHFIRDRITGRNEIPSLADQINTKASLLAQGCNK